MELTQFLRDYAASGISRFHMPGHKGSFPGAADSMGAVLPYDITEIDGADVLYQSEGMLRRLEERLARFYGVSGTLLSAGGSTLCIQAMLAAAFREGDAVLAVRNAHTAFVNSCALLGLRPVWAYPEPLDSAGISGAVTPAQIADALRQHPEVKGVYLTSPDYLGVRSDIRAISDICHDMGLPLLVDNAHGAALVLAGPGEHPMAQGADLCCDSAHKTLPVLTGGAFLHLSSRYDRADIKAKMALFGSTSPSYLILASVDGCLDWLAAEGRAAYAETAARVMQLKALCRERGLPCIDGRCDPYRLSVRTGALGYSDEAAGQHFRRHRIEPEYIGGGYTVLMASPCNPPRDWERLEAALSALTPQEAPAAEAVSLPPAEAVLTPREAVFAPGETVPAGEAAGRIAAQTVIACPPGVPVVIPGEKITPVHENILKNSGIFALKVVK